MTKEGTPRRGSLQFTPRKRAKRLLPRVRSWAKGEGVLGFIGYKVGMTTAMVVTTNPQSPFAGREVVKAATVVEVPPMILRAIRLYKKTPYGNKLITETSNVKDLPDADFARLVFEAQTKKAGFPRKTPDYAELAYGGDLEATVKFFTENINKEIKVSEIFKDNDFLDITGVTKGKGLQGPVRRFGVRLLPSKVEKSRRKPGSLGPWTPERTPWQAPMAGQTGYHTRTEYNKQILKIGEKLNPKSGWKRYGKIKSEYMLVLGSVQGPAKRTLVLRRPHRKGGYAQNLQHIIMDGEKQ